MRFACSAARRQFTLNAGEHMTTNPDATRAPNGRRYLSQPLVKHIFTADPSAHVFEGKIYIYPSHDIDAGLPEDDFGGHFGMEDYHILSMKSPEDGKAKDNGVALHVKDVPWAEKQFWAPDA